jgi:hypothetical protein
LTEDEDEQGYTPEDAHQDRGQKKFRGTRAFQFESCPACPDIKKKIDRIDLALLGPDGTGMNDGIVHAITQLQKNGQVQASWISFIKPVAVAVVSSLLTFVLTYELLDHSQLALLVAKLAELKR